MLTHLARKVNSDPSVLEIRAQLINSRDVNNCTILHYLMITSSYEHIIRHPIFTHHSNLQRGIKNIMKSQFNEDKCTFPVMGKNRYFRF